MDNAGERKDQQEQQLSLALDDPRESEDTSKPGVPETAGHVVEADQTITSGFFNRVLAALRR